MYRCQYVVKYLFWRFLAFETHIGHGIVLQPLTKDNT